MNVRTLIPLVAGLGVGGLALFLGVNTLKNARAGQKAAPRVNVWAAKTEIARGTAITEEMLQPFAFPADLAPKNAFREKEKLVGRVPRLDAPAGLPVLEDMLAPPNSLPGLQPPEGYDAASIRVDSSSAVGYHVFPGCRVNVTASFKRAGQKDTIARTLLEDIEVAAVGPHISVSTGKEPTSGKKESPRTVREITLFVKPEQVKTLLLAEQFGKIKLSLRGSGEALLEGEDWLSDLDLKGLPDPNEAPKVAEVPATRPAEVVAAAPPVPAWEVYVYRGPKSEVLKFKGLDSPERFEEPAAALETNHPGVAAGPPAAKPGTPADVPSPAPEPQEEPETIQEPEEPTE